MTIDMNNAISPMLLSPPYDGYVYFFHHLLCFRYLFIVDNGYDPKIVRYNMDGTNRLILTPSSGTFDCYQSPSIAINRHQSPSIAINRHQSPSIAINRLTSLSSASSSCVISYMYNAHF